MNRHERPWTDLRERRARTSQRATVCARRLPSVGRASWTKVRGRSIEIDPAATGASATGTVSIGVVRAARSSRCCPVREKIKREAAYREISHALFCFLAYVFLFFEGSSHSAIHIRFQRNVDSHSAFRFQPPAAPQLQSSVSQPVASVFSFRTTL